MPTRKRPARPRARKDSIGVAEFEEDPISQLQTQLFEAKDSHEVDREISLLFQIAELATERDDPALASLHYKIAAGVISKSKHHQARLCEALGQQALHFRSVGKLDHALTFAQEAVDAAHKFAGPLAEGRWLGLLGNIQRLLKSPDKAREAFVHASRLFRAEGKAGLAGLADQEGNLGLLAHEAHDAAGAEAAYRRAAEAAAEAKDADRTVTWENNLARSLMRRRCYHEAWSHLERAMTAARSLGKDDLLVMVARNWAMSYSQAHLYEDAANLSLETAKSAADVPGRVALLENALPDLRVAQDWKRAVETGELLIELWRELNDPKGRLVSLRKEVAADRHRLSRRPTRPFERKPGDYTPVDAYIIDAMSHYDQQKNASGMAEIAHLVCDIAIGLADPGQGGWSELMREWLSHYRIVAEAVAALIEADMPFQAFELSQRIKCVGFCHPNLQRLSETGGPHQEAKDYLAAWQNLQQKVAALREATPDDVALRCHAVRAAGEMMLEAGERLRERDRVLHARLGGLIRPHDLLDGLPVESPVAIVDLVVGLKGTAMHILERNGDQVILYPVFATTFTNQELGELLEVWLTHHVANEISASQFEGIKRISATLHARLFCSLASFLAKHQVTQIVLVPDVGLAPLPLHLAGICAEHVEEILKYINVEPKPTDAHLLCEAFPVEYASCVQAIAASQYQKFPRQIKKVIALSDPCSDLPGARATAEWLAKTAAGASTFTSWSGPDANRANLMSGLQQADIVVMGTHGEFSAGRPGHSYLVLSDGHWTLDEMLDQGPLSTGPLLVLSACEVGSSTLSADPRQASGIPGALLSGGAAAVIAALWPAEDVSLGVLVERFIHYMSGRGLRPSAALYRAILYLKRMTKEQALERCDQLMESVGRSPSSPARAAQMLQLDNLRDGLDEHGGEFPFASPTFWGGLVVIGSGWHSAAGASAGTTRNLGDFIRTVVEETGIRHQLGEGKFAEVRATIEKLLPRLDGGMRADALDELAWAIWNTRLAGTDSAAEHEALTLLNEVEALARSEQDEQLLRNIAATRKKIAMQKAAHHRRNHVKTNHN